MSASDWIHLDVAQILRQTDRALLLLLGSGREVWVPLSQVADHGTYSAGDKDCTVSVSRWLAEREGWDQV